MDKVLVMPSIDRVFLDLLDLQDAIIELQNESEDLSGSENNKKGCDLNNIWKLQNNFERENLIYKVSNVNQEVMKSKFFDYTGVPLSSKEVRSDVNQEVIKSKNFDYARVPLSLKEVRSDASVVWKPQDLNSTVSNVNREVIEEIFFDYYRLSVASKVQSKEQIEEKIKQFDESTVIINKETNIFMENHNVLYFFGCIINI